VKERILLTLGTLTVSLVIIPMLTAVIFGIVGGGAAFMIATLTGSKNIVQQVEVLSVGLGTGASAMSLAVGIQVACTRVPAHWKGYSGEQ
jgi:hypothetical protein